VLVGDLLNQAIQSLHLAVRVEGIP
jgi:hypothetical protein